MCLEGKFCGRPRQQNECNHINLAPSGQGQQERHLSFQITAQLCFKLSFTGHEIKALSELLHSTANAMQKTLKPLTECLMNDSLLAVIPHYLWTFPLANMQPSLQVNARTHVSRQCRNGLLTVTCNGLRLKPAGRHTS